MNLNHWSYSLHCTTNTPETAHAILRPLLVSYLRQVGIPRVQHFQVWTSTWEALSNAWRYGAEVGDTLTVDVHLTPTRLNVEIVQPKPWPEARSCLTQIRNDMLTKFMPGGLANILSLNDRVEFLDGGRRIRMSKLIQLQV